MTSRQMDGLGRAGDDRATAVAALVPADASRLAAVGWDDVAELAALDVALVAADGPDQLPDESFDAVLWTVDAARADTAALGRLRERLAERGRLAVRGRPADGEDAAAVGRRLVRLLSESGFVVLEELESEALGGRLVTARRDDYRIRPFAAEDGDAARDADAIRRLFVESFHVERGPAHWRWKYHENPWANRVISLAVAPGGELAVHYAGYGMPFWCDGRGFLGLQMGDTMTAEAYRKVGRGTSSLLARTVRHFFAVHRQGPFGFFYGFNRGAIRRFSRWFIGGSQVEPVRFRRHALDAAPPWSARGYRVERVERVGASWDRFFRRVAPRYGFLVQRDARYVDWRYLRCPDLDFVVLAARRFGRLSGWAVFRRHEDRLLWGDALLAPRHARAAEALLAAALVEPGLAGASAVEGWFSDRPGFVDAELDRLGFEVLPHPQELALMILPDAVGDPPLERLYYTMGDGDLF